MRLPSLLVAPLLLVALAPACAGRPDPQRAAIPRPTYPQAAPPYSQPQGYSQPQAYSQPQGYSQGPWQPASATYPTYPAPGAGAPYPAPAPGPAPSAYSPQVSAVPLNAIALHALRSTPCAPEEVAPGVWVSFDCSNPEPVRRATAFASRSSVFAGPLPMFVDHRVDGTEGPVKNQGAVGACTAFSLSSAMDNAIRRTGRSDVISPLHIWSKYGIPNMGVAGDQNVEERIALEPAWPYNPAKACKLSRIPLDSCGSAYGVASGTGMFDPTLRAEQKMADAAGRYRVASVEEIRTSPPSVQEIAGILASGDDIWAAFWVDSAAWKHRSLTNGVIPDYNRRGSAGHAVVLAGYRTVGLTRQFLVHNSWSEKWGDRGYGWISEAMLQRHLRSAYRVRVADASGSLPPSPLPSPPAPSGACPSGQVNDSVLGTCAALCPGGSPPAAGACLPAIPGFPGGFPVPAWPRPSGCPQGQVNDVMTGQCVSACPGGTSAVGGMCIPVIPIPGRQ